MSSGTHRHPHEGEYERPGDRGQAEPRTDRAEQGPDHSSELHVAATHAPGLDDGRDQKRGRGKDGAEHRSQNHIGTVVDGKDGKDGNDDAGHAGASTSRLRMRRCRRSSTATTASNGTAAHKAAVTWSSSRRAARLEQLVEGVRWLGVTGVLE